jgi:hypothetical protein
LKQILRYGFNPRSHRCERHLETVLDEADEYQFQSALVRVRATTKGFWREDAMVFQSARSCERDEL